jgi:hypothetical protein
MHLTVSMTALDHALALAFVREATPAHMDRTPLELLTSGWANETDGAVRVEGRPHELGNLVWALYRCMELVELDCSAIARFCGEAFDHDLGGLLDAAAERLSTAISDEQQNVDHDGDDDDRDDRLVDCGPEYPRNDAGEWIGRM